MDCEISIDDEGYKTTLFLNKENLQRLLDDADSNVNFDIALMGLTFESVFKAHTVRFVDKFSKPGCEKESLVLIKKVINRALDCLEKDFEQDVMKYVNECQENKE